MSEVKAILNSYSNIKAIEHRQNYLEAVYEIDIIFMDDTFIELEIENEENNDIAKMLELNRWCNNG